MPRILIVEDELSIATLLRDDLALEGHEVDIVSDGEAAIAALTSGRFDLAILDVMLPGKDGFEVCRTVRGAGLRMPIIMLTAKTQESDKVMGLEIGADDYVTKPFGARELRARVKAALRRAAVETPEIYRFGQVEVDFGRRELRCRRRPARGDDDRIQAAVGLHRASRPGALARAVAERGLGPRRVRHRPRRRHAHRQLAPEDRARSGRAAIRRQRAGRRVPLRRVARPQVSHEPDTDAIGSRRAGETMGLEVATMRKTRGPKSWWGVAVVALGAVALVAASTAIFAQKADQAEALLQAARAKHVVEGKLDEAVAIYRDVLARYGTNRPVAARALVGLGQCYEKLGAAQAAEARKAYERIVAAVRRPARCPGTRAGAAGCAGGNRRRSGRFDAGREAGMGGSGGDGKGDARRPFPVVHRLGCEWQSRHPRPRHGPEPAVDQHGRLCGERVVRRTLRALARQQEPSPTPGSTRRVARPTCASSGSMARSPGSCRPPETVSEATFHWHGRPTAGTCSPSS